MSNKTKKKTSRKTPARKIKKPKEPKVGEYIGNEYESFCELSCLFFCEELMKLGYVEKVERSPSYLLCDPVQNTYAEQLKRGSKQVTQTVALGVTYTPDYDIYFTAKALGVFCWELGSDKKWDKNLLVAQKVGDLYRACCEVKPDFQRASTTPKSVQSMKWLMQRRGVYVNLFRPNRMFEGLFVPEKYKITERGTPRVLKFKALNLQQYLKSKL
jgi:hypothetical protein